MTDPMTAPEPLSAMTDAQVDLLRDFDDGTAASRLVQRLIATLDAARVAAPSDGLREVQNDIEMLCYAILGGTSFLPHRDAAQRVLAALATTGQPEHYADCPKYLGEGPCTCPAQPEDTRTADPGGLREHAAALLKLARFMYEAPEGTDRMEQLGELVANACNGLPAVRAALTPEATAPEREVKS